ncbi:MAG TPA: YqaE/Pmp3 family membrane protein [Bacteroidales bacterium]|nr:YqaE/Pmp3 family membrane protein [Bacteroidales bacterium]
MKTLTTKLVTGLLLVFFVIGFCNVADAAFAGKKQQNQTEMVSPAPTNPPASLPAADTDTILLVILCFILPPLAVYLKYEEVGTPFIVNLVLTIFFWIPGVIHALYHVLK